MFINYLKIAIRHIKNNKGYVFLNVLGLAVGLTCSVFIMFYIQDELSYDNFFNDKDRIYRVVAEKGEENSVTEFANTSYPIAPNLKVDFPEIEEATRLRAMFQPVIQYESTKHREDRFFVADTSFFKVLDLPLLAGNSRNALKDPGSVVLTKEASLKYFGNENPIGKTMLYRSGFGGSQELTVTGILADLPDNTHLEVDFIAPIESFNGTFGRWQVFVQNYTYIKTTENADIESLTAKLPGFIERHVGQELESGEIFNLSLQPISSIHLHSQRENEIKGNGNIIYIYVFSGIGLLILAIAGINFMNMFTAKSSERAQEVGMRKVLGGTRTELIRQFMMDSIVLSFFALVCAVVFSIAFLPYFNSITGKAFTFDLATSLWFFPSLACISLLIGILAGSYPALLLSSFKPVQVLKSKAATGGSGELLRKSLVVFQFAVTVILIIGSMVIYRQLIYVENQDLGFDKEQVVVIPIDNPTGDKAESIKEELLRNSNISNVTASMLVPSEQMWTYSVRRANQSTGITTGYCRIDYDFFDTFAIPLSAGRYFQKGISSDSTSGYILNEEAVEQLGFNSPEEAIGEPIVYGSDSNGNVVGVVKNFHSGSFHSEIGPAIFFIDDRYNYLSVKLATENASESLEYIESKLAEFSPNLPFEYSFLDRRFDQLYGSDKQIAQVVAAFSFMSIVIACFGLFGLVAYAAQKRTKEIGIRKVIGASSVSIFKLLTKDFLKLIVIGFLIALPIAHYAAGKWLQNFAYHIEPGVGMYMLAGLITFVIAITTVSYQSIKASLMNPVNSLKSQ